MKSASRLPAAANQNGAEQTQPQIAIGPPRATLHLPQSFGDPAEWNDGETFVMVKHSDLLWEVMPYTKVAAE